MAWLGVVCSIHRGLRQKRKKQVGNMKEKETFVKLVILFGNTLEAVIKDIYVAFYFFFGRPYLRVHSQENRCSIRWGKEGPSL